MDDGDSGGRRDLNGRRVAAGRWARLRARLGGEHAGMPLSVDDPELTVVAASDDDAIASSTALSASSWQPEEEVVLRHVLRLPAHRLDEAVALAALDGYRVVDAGRWGALSAEVPSSVGLAVLVVARVQLLDAMHLSQERSRMASLGSRHGGTALGWQVLQRPAADDRSG